jgi:hypothetical protein
MRSLLSELRLAKSSWRDLLALCALISNSAKVRRLGNKSPGEVIYGSSFNPKLISLNELGEFIDVEAYVATLENNLVELHKAREESILSLREPEHSDDSVVQQITANDLVLWSNLETTKLSRIWEGPFCVVKVLGSNITLSMRFLE